MPPVVSAHVPYHYCGAKVQQNYNCYNVYFNECLLFCQTLLKKS